MVYNKKIILSAISLFFVSSLILLFISACEGIFPVPEPITYTITVLTGNNGDINPEGKIIVSEGEEQNFTMTPDEGYKVEDVLVDGGSVGAVSVYTFKDVQQDHTIQASFQKKPQPVPTVTVKTYAITSTTAAGGTINPSGEITVTEGADQSFAITADEGYKISDVLVDDLSVGAVSEYIFADIKQDHTIEAKFIGQFTITASAGNNGSIEPEGEITILQGESQTFTITPDICYQIEKIIVKGTEVAEIESHYTIDDIQEDYNIEVSFALSDKKIRRYNQSGELQNDDYNSIQDAINDSVDGDTIIVCPGTYHENLVFDGKDITVKSTDPSNPDIVATTIIDGDVDGDETGDGSVVSFMNGDTSTLEGFTLTNGIGTLMGSYTAGGGTYIDSSSPNISGNIIEGNKSANGGGIYITGNSSPEIEKNIIRKNNSSDEAGGGIYIKNSSPKVFENIISNNLAFQNGGGIYIEGGYIESNNCISGNVIRNNITTHDGGGIYLSQTSPVMESNNIKNNTANIDGGGIYLNSSSPNITGNNIITENSAANGGGIYIKNSYNSTTENTVNGNSIVKNTASYSGGGIYINNSMSNIAGNNNISENEAQWGGGIYMVSSSPEISGNSIIGNSAIGASGSGGGIYMNNSSPHISSNTMNLNIAGNNGGAISMSNSYSNEEENNISGNTIESNSANHGGGIYINKSNPKITNNLSISTNSALHGGAIMIQGDNSIEMSNNNIKNNQAEGFGGGINVSPGTVLLPDSVRPVGWGSSDDEDYREDIPVEEGENGDLNPSLEDEYKIAGNVFQGNEHGNPLDYTEGAHVYFH